VYVGRCGRVTKIFVNTTRSSPIRKNVTSLPPKFHNLSNWLTPLADNTSFDSVILLALNIHLLPFIV
jgi:hypothetical protein